MGPITKIRVNDIGEYVRMGSCQMRLKLAFNDDEIPRRTPFYSYAHSPLDPSLQQAGKLRESQVESILVKRGYRNINPAFDIDDRESFMSFRELLDRASDAVAGSFYAREVRIEGTLNGFELMGRIDFVLVTWEDGRPTIRVVECKSSRLDKVHHRIQLTFYLILARMIVEGHPTSTAHWDTDRIEGVIVRIDELTNIVQDPIDQEPLDIEIEEADCMRLIGPNGPIASIDGTDVSLVPFELSPHCDSCVYQSHCFPEAMRSRRIELLSIDPTSASVLAGNGISTIDDMAELEIPSPLAHELTSSKDLNVNLKRMKMRAKALRAEMPGGRVDGEYGVMWLDSDLPMDVRRFRSNLPHHIVGGEPLVRVFVSIEFDYVENRVMAMSAHLTCEPMGTASDRQSPQEGVRDDPPGTIDGIDIVEFLRVPWTGDLEADNALETDLIYRFHSKLLDGVEGLKGEARFPIHFYFWSMNDIDKLVEAAIGRLDGRGLQVIAELLGCREGLDEQMFSLLGSEIRQSYATGHVSDSPVVLSSLRWFRHVFQWSRDDGDPPIRLDEVFKRNLFDFTMNIRTDEDGLWTDSKDGQWGRYEVRSRFFDGIPVPYMRAIWGTLPDEGEFNRTTARAIRDFSRVDETKLVSYLKARARLFRFFEEAMRDRNGSITKRRHTVRELRRYTLGPSDMVRSSYEFIRLDQISRRHGAYRDNLEPPVCRMAAGSCIPLRDVRCVDGTIRGHIDLPTWIAPDEYGRLCSLDVGQFVRLTRRGESLFECQGMDDLVRNGLTVRLTDVDWGGCEITASPVPFTSSDTFFIESSWFDEDYSAEYAVMDRNDVSDYVNYRVDKRLRSLMASERTSGDDEDSLLSGDRMDPNVLFRSGGALIPRASELGPSERERWAGVLKGFEYKGRPLNENQRNAILDGTSTTIQLVLGPPGTGKTLTAAVALLMRINIHHTREGEEDFLVFVTANTHTAVNEILRRIDDVAQAFREAMRGNGIQQVPIEIIKCHSSEIDEDEDLPRHVMRCQADDFNRRDRVDFIGNWLDNDDFHRVRIVGGTVATIHKVVERLSRARSSIGMRFSHPPILAIDEASMITFAQLTSLTSFVRLGGGIMLSGDYNQLSPILSHDWKEEKRSTIRLFRPDESAYMGVKGLIDSGTTDRRQCLESALDVTYRCPSPIVSLIGPIYDTVDLRPYEGRVEPRFEGGLGIKRLWREEGVFLIVHDEHSSKRNNEVEVGIVGELLRGADRSSVSDLAIMTPHCAQRASLRTLLVERGLDEMDIVVDTVERMQGGERSNIIYSATQSDPSVINRRPGFIMDKTRTNVAFSRAARRLFVICSQNILDSIPSDVDTYEDMRLWKTLRARCTEEVGRIQLDDHEDIDVRVLTMPR